MTERKSKVFSLRLSPDEYQHLRKACADRGVRSIGELARTAMHQMLGPPADNSSKLSDAVHDLRRRIAELSTDIETLSKKLPTNGTSS